jgi:zinc transporter 2
MDPEDELRVSLLPTNVGGGTFGPRAVSACVLAEGINNEDKQKRYQKTQRKLLFALVVAFLFMFVEIAGGIWAHSLAIITDAAHLLSDVSGFAVSAAAAYYAAKRSHQHFSYGYHRIEVLGALASVLSVWLVTGILLWEAVGRVLHPSPVDGKIMTIIALLGVVVNIALMSILGVHGHSHGGGHSHSGHSHGAAEHAEHSHFHRDGDHGELSGSAAEEGHHHAAEELSSSPSSIHNHTLPHQESHNHTHTHTHSPGSNINIRGAVIHVIGDLVQSIGVAIAGALIWYHQDDPRWALADPICTFLFAALVLGTTFAILKDIGDILMERAPRGGKGPTEILKDLIEIEGVKEVHDLHLWSLTPGIPLLCAHVATAAAANPAEVLRKVTSYCRIELGIEHTTIQMVDGDGEACTCGVNLRENSK